MWNCMKPSYRGVFRTLANNKMEGFAKIVNGLHSLTIFVKRFMLDFCQGSEYASSILVL